MAKFSEIIKATWNVMWGKDKKKSEPKKKTKRDNMSKEEIKDFRTHLAEQKAKATEDGEPWVAILDLDVDYDNLDYGSFELDWNDKFVANLLRAGYVGKTDNDIVEQWFNNVCRNVVMETYEQVRADPVQSRKLDNGRKEYR